MSNEDRPDINIATTSTLSMEALAAELRQVGKVSFGEKYPHPFLKVNAFRKSKSGFIEPRTMILQRKHKSESVDSAESVTEEPSETRTLCIPLVKSNRNAYGAKVTLGRARNNDIVIRASRVSKLHCVFVPQADGNYHLMDMGSFNGTKANGSRLEKNEPVTLKTGDEIEFCRYAFEYFNAQDFIEELRRMP